MRSFLSKSLNTVVSLAPAVAFSSIAYSQVADQIRQNHPVNEVPGIVWANLAFCTALVFHAGMLVSRHKSLESRIDKLEEQEMNVHFAGLEQKVNAMDRRLDSMHDDIREIKNYYENIFRKELTK